MGESNLKSGLIQKAFFIFGVEGVVFIGFDFLTPSEAGEAVLFGFSWERLALFVLHLAACLACFAVWAYLRSFSEKNEYYLRHLEKKLIQDKRLVEVVFALGVMGILGALPGVWAILTRPSFLVQQPDLRAIYLPAVQAVLFRLAPFLLWIALALVQSAVFLALTYRKWFFQPAYWDAYYLSFAGLVVLGHLSSLWQWIILFMQIPVFQNIPGWYWPLKYRPLSSGSLGFILVGSLFIGAAWVIFRWNKRPALLLGIIALVGVLAQYQIGIAMEGGLSSLADRYFLSYHRAYVESACQQNEPLLDIISNYQSLYGQTLFQGSKPPGLVFFYSFLDRGLSWLWDHTGLRLAPFYALSVNVMPGERCYQLAGWVLLLFPALSMLLVPAVYGFIRGLLNEKGEQYARFIAPILLVGAPNIIFFSQFHDQALYPALFLGVAAAAVLAAWRGSFWSNLLTGAVIYLALFFSFSILPIAAFVLAYLLIYAFQTVQIKRIFPELVRSGVPLLLGFLGFYLLFWLLFQYDAYSRYQAAMKIVKDFDFYMRVGEVVEPSVTLLGRLQQILEAALLNNVELGSAIGFPVFFLFVLRGIKGIWRTVRKVASRGEGVETAFFAAYLGMNALGAMRGEAARLLTYWTPVVCILAALELENQAIRRRWLLIALVVCQLITVVVTFHFQDFRMPELLP